MIALLVSFFIGLIIFLLPLLLFRRKFSLSGLLYTLAYGMFLLCLAIVNFELEIFEQKFASQFAYDVFLGKESLTNNSGFMLQYILNIPAFIVTKSWWAAIATNIVLFSCVFWYVYENNRKFVFILFAPAILNFSMFSLRDPIISVMFFMLTMMLVNKQNRGHSHYRQASLASLFLIIRPENILIFVGAKVTQLITTIKSKAKLVLLFPILLVIVYIGLTMVPKALGLQWSGSLLDLPLVLTDFYEARANRWDTPEGGGSNILGGGLSGMPFIFRYPIQVFTFFVLPLPFEITKVSLVLAFIDSIFFCYLAVRFHRVANKETKILFWCYILLLAFFSNNYGNVFRLRLPVYFIMLAGLIKRD